MGRPSSRRPATPGAAPPPLARPRRRATTARRPRRREARREPPPPTSPHCCCCACPASPAPRRSRSSATAARRTTRRRNTVASFEEAWRQKADAAELDVYLTKDGRLVVIHDANTKRTTGRDGKVAEMTLAELRKLDAGKWKGQENSRARGFPPWAKCWRPRRRAGACSWRSSAAPEAVPELLRVLKASKLGPERTPVISFNAKVIAAVKKARPGLPAYWLVGPQPQEGREASHGEGADRQGQADQGRRAGPLGLRNARRGVRQGG